MVLQQQLIRLLQQIDDPILLLASNQTGSGAVDIGILGERGDDTNVFMGYDESADEFIMAQTSTSDSNTTITATDYAPLHIGGLTADDNATVGGTLTVTGQVQFNGDANVSGQINAGAIDGTSLNVYTGNIAGGNLKTPNVTIADSTITATGDVTLSANGADFITFYGNVEAANGKGYFNNVQSQSVYNQFGNVELYSGTAGKYVKVPTGNLFAIEDLTAGRVVYVAGDGQLTDQANLTFNGYAFGAPSFVASGQITGATMDATGNITGGNLLTGNVTIDDTTITATGNITGGN